MPPNFSQPRSHIGSPNGRGAQGSQLFAFDLLIFLAATDSTKLDHLSSLCHASSPASAHLPPFPAAWERPSTLSCLGAVHPGLAVSPTHLIVRCTQTLKKLGGTLCCEGYTRLMGRCRYHEPCEGSLFKVTAAKCGVLALLAPRACTFSPRGPVFSALKAEVAAKAG